MLSTHLGFVMSCKRAFRLAALRLLQLVNERYGRFLPRSQIGHIETK